MLSLIQLNVEQSKHIARIVPFLRERAFDVACLQELKEVDILSLKEAQGASHHAFVPTSNRDGVREGVGIISRFPLSEISVHHYAGDALIHDHVKGSPRPAQGTFMRAVLFATVETPEGTLRVGVTHFTWTPDGEASDAQRVDLDALFSALEQEKAFVLCGDFNAPRGKEIYTKLAERYTDNIPHECTWSLDQELHRAPLAERKQMVDGIFSTPDYEVTNVERVCGLSDHCAFTAHISKKNSTI